MTSNLKLSVIVWAFVLISGLAYANPVEVSRVENNSSIGDNAMKTKRESSLLGSDDKRFVINEDFAVDNLVQAVHQLRKRSPGLWSSLKSIGKNLLKKAIMRKASDSKPRKNSESTSDESQVTYYTNDGSNENEGGIIME
ncbi:hypothetical protein PV326_004781 [Microctonus aethiopoides]|nr:hypothetical protein PV326_004781 [Microctonus aethiopoides]